MRLGRAVALDGAREEGAIALAARDVALEVPQRLQPVLVGGLQRRGAENPEGVRRATEGA